MTRHLINFLIAVLLAVVCVGWPLLAAEHLTH